MIADVILGNNMDTSLWIDELEEYDAEFIIVIDYDSEVKYKKLGSVAYISAVYAAEYIKEFDKVNFYKSLYAYPGMNGNMSSLYNKG